jgi:hypothetical protein
LTFSCSLSRIASSTRVFDAVVRALRDDSHVVVEKWQVARVSPVQRTPTRFDGNPASVLHPVLEGDQKHVK